MSRVAPPVAGPMFKGEGRVTDPRHLAFVRKLPCCYPGCARTPCGEAAHVRMNAPGKGYTGMGTKPSDKWTVPLCHEHHMEQHRGGERAFWARLRIDPVALAAAIWDARTSASRARALALMPHLAPAAPTI